MPAATRILQVNEVNVQTLNDVLRQIRDLFDNISAESLFRVSFFHDPIGVTTLNVGTTYVEIAEGRQQIDFSRQTVAFARLLVRGSGNEATAGKGIAITDEDGRVVVEVTWNDNLVTELYHVGAWTALTLTDDRLLRLAQKGSSATEDMDLFSVVMECRGVVQIKTVQR